MTGNLKLTQKFLGHADINTTANVYTHVSEKLEREVVENLEKKIFGNLFPIVPNLKLGTEIQ